MILIFATRNRGKVTELRELLAPLRGIEVRPVDDSVPDVIEDGLTFGENAAKKALQVSAATGLPALADDSGLEVDALGGAPGVHSARYAGPECDDAKNNAKLLQKLEGYNDRRARFQCALALADVSGSLGDQVLTAEGSCEGEILEAPRGAGGFGYDPLFYCFELGSTFAELGVGTKNQRSHRAKAMQTMLPKLIEYFQLENPVRGG